MICFADLHIHIAHLPIWKSQRSEVREYVLQETELAPCIMRRKLKIHKQFHLREYRADGFSVARTCTSNTVYSCRKCSKHVELKSRAEGLTLMLRFARARNPLVLEYATALLQVLKQDNLFVELSGIVPTCHVALGHESAFRGVQNPEVKR